MSLHTFIAIKAASLWAGCHGREESAWQGGSREKGRVCTLQNMHMQTTMVRKQLSTFLGFPKSFKLIIGKADRHWLSSVWRWTSVQSLHLEISTFVARMCFASLFEAWKCAKGFKSSSSRCLPVAEKMGVSLNQKQLFKGRWVHLHYSSLWSICVSQKSRNMAEWWWTCGWHDGISYSISSSPFRKLRMLRDLKPETCLQLKSQVQWDRWKPELMDQPKLVVNWW